MYSNLKHHNKKNMNSKNIMRIYFTKQLGIMYITYLFWSWFVTKIMTLLKNILICYVNRFWNLYKTP